MKESTATVASAGLVSGMMIDQKMRTITGPIDQRCLVQFSRQRANELAQQEDIEGAAAENIRYPERIERVDPADLVEENELRDQA